MDANSTQSADPEFPAQAVQPGFLEAARFWLKLGFVSFGGPAGQVAIMHAELVERRRWVSDSRFLHALNFCMLLPGPEAQQLSIYLGWLLHGVRGGVVAGTFFVLPSMVVLWGLSWLYVVWGSLPGLAAFFYGLKPAVLALVLASAIRIGGKVLRSPLVVGTAGVAFLAVHFVHAPFPLLVFLAAVMGCAGTRFFGRTYSGASCAGTDGERIPTEDKPARPTFGRALRVGASCLALWWTPVLLSGLWLGTEHTLFKQGVFFSKTAVVTFGGAYAVLPYVAQQAVESFQWLSSGQMLDGLGLAETTPGPLIMVLQFVGFLGGWNQPGPLSPFVAATLGAFLTTWTTFVPCFLWVFLGAPHVEGMRGNKLWEGALSTISAVVVGVILHLALWFGAQVLFPANDAMDWKAAIIAALGFAGQLKWKWSPVQLVLGAGLVGMAIRLL